MLVYILLLEEIKEGASLKYVGPFDEKYLVSISQVALEQGFDLMFEFSEPPDMEEVVKRLGREETISAMPNMTRLWYLKKGIYNVN